MPHANRLLAGIAIALMSVALFACGGSNKAEPAPPAINALISHPELRTQLIDLFNRDQHARKEMLRAIRGAPTRPDGTMIYPESAMPLVRAVQTMDQESAEFLQTMIADVGWPTFDMVGRDGAESAWLLAQHADANPTLQRHALSLMEPLVKSGQASPANFAYLMDRVLVAERQPQIYGTQFAADLNGVQRPYPMIDPGAVNRRRLQVGLPSIAFAAKQMQRSTGGDYSTTPLHEFPARRSD